MNYKEPLLNQIDALILTMTQVKDSEGQINMSDWHIHTSVKLDDIYPVNKPVNVDLKVEHFCDTIACIIGYQVLSNRLEAFPITLSAAANAKYAKYIENNIATIANNITIDLAQACVDIFGNRHLIDSIYVTDAYFRQEKAKLSDLFSLNELVELEHLNEAKPSTTDIIDYLILCREKVVQYKQSN